ncbi:hypothetical protein [Streptomyces sp. NPDC059819]|uniref:hypothetical protein n=1 Tax=Streptomyces sp. NPDC059819 TaxID=3346963 RepID=UPI003666124E
MLVRDLDQLENELVQGRRQSQRGFVQAESDALLVVKDVRSGQAAVAGGALPIEQDHQSGDPVLGLEGVVGERLTGECPAFVGVEPVRGGQLVDEAGRFTDGDRSPREEPLRGEAFAAGAERPHKAGRGGQDEGEHAGGRGRLRLAEVFVGDGFLGPSR